MKKLVIIMLALLAISQNSTAQTFGGETKIFPMVGLTLSKMNNDIILTNLGNGQAGEIKPKYKFGITAGAEVRHRFNNNDFENGTIENGQYIPDAEKSGEASNTSTDIFKRFDIGIPVGVTYEYKNISIDLRYLFGLKNLYKYYDERIRNRSFSLTIGYGFTI